MHNVIILIKSVLNKDKNHYYHNIILEECSYQLAKSNHKTFFHSIIIWIFGETKVTEEKFCASKNLIKIWNVNGDNIVILKLVKTKTNFNYLIGYLDKAIRPLFLIVPKMSGYVKTFKVKDGDKHKNNKLMSFCIDDEMLLTNIELFGIRLKILKILN